MRRREGLDSFPVPPPVPVSSPMDAAHPPADFEDGPVDEWAEPGVPPAELFYPSVDRFVAEQLAPLYRRQLGHGRLWCRRWWAHAEAITRLEALWRSWEHLRREPALGMSVWLRDHADPHMAVLFDPDGPFKGCKPDQHGDRLDPLPVEDPPPGLFGDPQHR